MLIKRLILIAVSLAIGFAFTYASVHFLLGTNLDDYGSIYTIFTILSFGTGVGIWLDKFLDTKFIS